MAAFDRDLCPAQLGQPRGIGERGGCVVRQRDMLVKALKASSRGEASVQYAQKLAQMPKQQLLTWLLDWVSDLGRLKTCGSDAELVNEDQRSVLENSARQADTVRIFRLTDQINELIRAEGIALNQQLLWENLLISLDNI